jgi:hypothetical protein
MKSFAELMKMNPKSQCCLPNPPIYFVILSEGRCASLRNKMILERKLACQK